jgi:hypothetical protein
MANPAKTVSDRMAREKNASEENNAFEAAYRDEMINNLIAGSACAYGAAAADTSVFPDVINRLYRYCLAAGAARTWRQSGGSFASVIPGRGLGGSGGGFGCNTESLNQ